MSFPTWILYLHFSLNLLNRCVLECLHVYSFALVPLIIILGRISELPACSVNDVWLAPLGALYVTMFYDNAPTTLDVLVLPSNFTNFRNPHDVQMKLMNECPSGQMMMETHWQYGFRKGFYRIFKILLSPEYFYSIEQGLWGGGSLLSAAPLSKLDHYGQEPVMGTFSMGSRQ